ncbi:MAG: type II toxin-antitoxin system VapC family toxin [Betaproteobacteria bacterium]|nr:MAG: type II toxin-antitoxin system VapC family toxin [Betaproteobacteria bacterium]TMH29184.1 MAG: type II toxin-antitoxin system VapC family toxin [Betaproteobacteria bacterium]
MILVDTSVWVDHLRRGDRQLAELLERGAVVMHAFVVGEIACGSLTDRSSILELLQDLPMAVIADSDEILAFIEHHRLHGKGIGYVDVHLLASVALTHGTTLWTRDKRLRAAADALGCAYSGASAH